MLRGPFRAPFHTPSLIGRAEQPTQHVPPGRHSDSLRATRAKRPMYRAGQAGQRRGAEGGVSRRVLTVPAAETANSASGTRDQLENHCSWLIRVFAVHKPQSVIADRPWVNRPFYRALADRCQVAAWQGRMWPGSIAPSLQTVIDSGYRCAVRGVRAVRCRPAGVGTMMRARCVLRGTQRHCEGISSPSSASRACAACGTRAAGRAEQRRGSGNERIRGRFGGFWRRPHPFAAPSYNVISPYTRCHFGHFWLLVRSFVRLRAALFVCVRTRMVVYGDVICSYG